MVEMNMKLIVEMNKILMEIGKMMMVQSQSLWKRNCTEKR